MKDENLLKKGIPAKIYYFSYAAPVSIYEIAQNIYMVKKRSAENPNLLNQAKTLKKYNYLRTIPKEKEWKHNKLLADPTPLLNEIVTLLKKNHDFELDKNEKAQLYKILDSQHFRDFVGYYYDEVLPKKKSDIKIAFNAIEKLMINVSIAATYAFIAKASLGIEDNELQDIIALSSDVYDEKEKEFVKKIVPVSESMNKLSTKTLEKILSLSYSGKVALLLHKSGMKKYEKIKRKNK